MANTPSMRVSRSFPWMSAFPVHLLLLRIMPSTITPINIFSKYFPPLGPFAELGPTVLHFPKLSFFHLSVYGLLKHDITNSSAPSLFCHPLSHPGLKPYCHHGPLLTSLPHPPHLVVSQTLSSELLIPAFLPPLTWFRLTLWPWQGFCPGFPASQAPLTPFLASPWSCKMKILEHHFPSCSCSPQKPRAAPNCLPTVYNYLMWKLCLYQTVLASYS